MRACADSLLGVPDQIRFCHERLKVLRSRASVWIGMALRAFRRNKSEFRSEYSVLAQVSKANDPAALTYIPRGYSGVITEFRPIKQYARYAGERMK